MQKQAGQLAGRNFRSPNDLARALALLFQTPEVVDTSGSGGMAIEQIVYREVEADIALSGTDVAIFATPIPIKSARDCLAIMFQSVNFSGTSLDDYATTHFEIDNTIYTDRALFLRVHATAGTIGATFKVDVFPLRAGTHGIKWLYTNGAFAMTIYEKQSNLLVVIVRRSGNVQLAYDDGITF